MIKKKISPLNRRITEVFRSLMTKFGLTSSQFSYVYDDELFYRGESIESKMSESECKCLDQAVRQVTIESLEGSWKE